MSYFLQSELALGAINSVAGLAGKNDKITALKEAMAHPIYGEFLQDVLLWAYDPQRNYGVKFIEPQGNTRGSTTLRDNWTVVQELGTGRLRGNAAKWAIQHFMEHADNHSAELFRRIVHKDMRAGFGISTLNKIKKGFIPEQPYMRCSLPAKSNLKNWAKDALKYLQLKADGMFQHCYYDGENVKWVSRAGETMPDNAFPLVEAEICLHGSPNSMYDGELTVYYEGKLLPRKTGNGLLNSVANGGALPEGHTVKFDIWDVVDTTYGPTGRPGVTYEDRFARVLFSFADCEHVETIECHPIHDLAQAVPILDKWMKAGLEGGILKLATATYKDGTSADQIKLKLEATVDVKIVGFKAGEKGKKTEKTFGAILYESSDGKVRGSVAGIDEKTVAKIHADREAYLGTIMSITANDISTNRDDDGYFALSHPRFDELRADKTEADSCERIHEIFADARLNFAEKLMA
jgi:DNA ligase-1